MPYIKWLLVKHSPSYPSLRVCTRYGVCKTHYVHTCVCAALSYLSKYRPYKSSPAPVSQTPRVSGRAKWSKGEKFSLPPAPNLFFWGRKWPKFKLSFLFSGGRRRLFGGLLFISDGAMWDICLEANQAEGDKFSGLERSPLGTSVLLLLSVCVVYKNSVLRL